MLNDGVERVNHIVVEGLWEQEDLEDVVTTTLIAALDDIVTIDDDTD